MPMRIEPYLAIIRNELSTSLKPRGDGQAKQVAIYLDRLLIQLLLRANVLPGLQRKALEQINGLLDELSALLRTIDGGIVLPSDLMQTVRNAPDFTLFEPVLERTLKLLLSQSGEVSRDMVRRISTILLEMHEALDRAASEMEKANEHGDGQPALDAEGLRSLQDWLRRRFPAEAVIEVARVTAMMGGGSKRTLLVELTHVSELPAAVVIRADQAAGVVESSVTVEYELIETLHACGLPVPRPFALEGDAAVLGAPFMLMSRVEGKNIGDHVECYEPSRSFALSLARALGKLHGIPPQRFGDGIVGADMSTVDCVRQNIAVFETMWRNTGERSTALELAFAWLKDHMHLADGLRALNHCDVGCHNMLASDGELTGLLDWETTMIGNPTHDLAYAYPLAVQMVPWEEFLAEYAQAGGTIPSPGEFDFYRVWTQAWRLPFLLVARSFIDSGLSSYIVHTYGAHHVYHHGSLNLHRLMQDILSRY